MKLVQAEHISKRSLDFSEWMRDHLPPSDGFLIDDVDWMLANTATKSLMFVEEKTNNAPVKKWQRGFMQFISDGMASFCRSRGWFWKGYHIVTFSGTCPKNSKQIMWDEEDIISVDELTTRLSMGSAPQIPEVEDILTGLGLE